MAGYSGTPLARKLGIKEAMAVAAVNGPDELEDWLAPLPDGATLARRLPRRADVVLTFVTERKKLATAWPKLTATAGDEGAIWVCWPKKASKVPTDVTEDVVREVALPTGWVDVKVCAVSEVWSGLRCVRRTELRGT